MHGGQLTFKLYFINCFPHQLSTLTTLQTFITVL